MDKDSPKGTSILEEHRKHTYRFRCVLLFRTVADDDVGVLLAVPFANSLKALLLADLAGAVDVLDRKRRPQTEREHLGERVAQLSVGHENVHRSRLLGVRLQALQSAGDPAVRESIDLLPQQCPALSRRIRQARLVDQRCVR